MLGSCVASKEQDTRAGRSNGADRRGHRSAHPGYPAEKLRQLQSHRHCASDPDGHELRQVSVSVHNTVGLSSEP